MELQNKAERLSYSTQARWLQKVMELRFLQIQALLEPMMVKTEDEQCIKNRRMSPDKDETFPNLIVQLKNMKKNEERNIEMNSLLKNRLEHNVIYISGFKQEEEDAHVTLTTVHDTQKNEVKAYRVFNEENQEDSIELNHVNYLMNCRQMASRSRHSTPSTLFDMELWETYPRHVDRKKMAYFLSTPSPCRTTLEAKDHPLEHVIGNPSQSVRTRRQAKTDGEIVCSHSTGIDTETKRTSKKPWLISA
ncbi:hypothetical protein Tco_0479096 [Tanacetum coccineum]